MAKVIMLKLHIFIEICSVLHVAISCKSHVSYSETFRKNCPWKWFLFNCGLPKNQWKIVDKIRLARTENWLLVVPACFLTVLKVWSIHPWAVFASETLNSHLHSLLCNCVWSSALRCREDTSQIQAWGINFHLGGPSFVFTMYRALDQELS